MTKKKKTITKKKTTKKKTTKKKNKVGAPSAYKPEYCQQLIDFMAQGFSFRSFATEVPKVTSGAMHEWAIQYKEFGIAKALAQDKYYRFWEDMGRRGTLGDIKNFNAMAWVFNMKNRFHWRNEIVIAESKKVESVTIELPEAKKQETITLKAGDWKESDK